MSYPTRKILWTIGGEETPAGTPHLMEYVIPIRGNPGLTRIPTRTPDPAIIGSDMDVGDYLSSDDVAGTIPLTPRACAGFGKLVNSLLHTESTPAQIGALIKIRFKGAEASCKIVADTGANTLAAKTGAAGSEGDDAAWGGGAPLDLTAAANDTVAELVAVIDAYADWECQKVFGDGATVSGLIVTKTTQAKNRWCYLWFTAATGGAYERHYTPDLTAVERPTYSIQADGYADNFLYCGCVTDTLSLTGALKGIVEADAGILGFMETIGQVASVLTLEDVSPLFFWDGSFDLAGTDFPYISNISIKIDNGHNKEGYGQGGVGRIYHEKGIFAITGDLELRLDADTYARRADIFGATGAYCSLSAYFKGKLISATMPEFLLVELPFIQVTNFVYGEKNGIFTAKMNWKAIKPKGTVWDVPLTVTMITADSGAY
jgi:hypothetical protein